MTGPFVRGHGTAIARGGPAREEYTFNQHDKRPDCGGAPAPVVLVEVVRPSSCRIRERFDLRVYVETPEEPSGAPLEA